MTKLFVLDLDGCVTHPFITPHWDSITKIRELSIQSYSDSTIPQLSICTGRPYPYAEAVAQWLDIRNPIVFESGGGVYFPTEQRVKFADGYLRHYEEVDEIREMIQELINDRFPDVLPEFSKKTDVGMVHADGEIIGELFDICTNDIAPKYSNFEVHRTDVSVNVILKSCNKGNGLYMISSLTEIPLSEVAYIGDSTGDISALKIVGKPFVPANASESIKMLGYNLNGETSIGVLEAYHMLIEQNRFKA
jgi:hydroxymethylpyrimidine pyrophosphatase-like HAD family hydrolase